jgi:hypothetical protein
MSARDIEIANQFLAALAGAAETGDRESVIPFLSVDVEWVTPKRTLRGVDEVRRDLTWLRPPDNLDVAFDRLEVRDHAGEGTIAVDVHEVYRLRGSGGFAYECDRHVELTIRGGAVARYEMREVG